MPFPTHQAALATADSGLLEEQPLKLLAAPQAPAAGILWRVVASAPSLWDLPPRSSFHSRIPGNIAVLEHPDSAQLRLCSGFLPCGQCPACQSGLQLACSQPQRPGANLPGAFATHLWLPQGPAAAFLAPLEPLLETCTAAAGGKGRAERLAHILALVAAAGPCYQAQATAGMVPGDTVLILGDPGPGLLPLRLLSALGLRPFWITAQPPSVLLPPGAQQRQASPAAEELPSPTCHLLILRDAGQLLETAALWPLCHSCTFVGPHPPQLESSALARLLAGELALRWFSDLHPHLVLDVAALAVSGRIELAPWVGTSDWGGLAGAYSAFCQPGSSTWPVLLG